MFIFKLCSEQLTGIAVQSSLSKTNTKGTDAAEKLPGTSGGSCIKTRSDCEPRGLCCFPPFASLLDMELPPCLRAVPLVAPMVSFSADVWGFPGFPLPHLPIPGSLLKLSLIKDLSLAGLSLLQGDSAVNERR